MALRIFRVHFGSPPLSPLPPELTAAIRKLIDGQGSLATRSRDNSAHYRKGGTSNAAVDFHAYLVTRLPATFAAVTACLKQLPENFSPASILDAGSGPGTASWAASELFPEIASFTFLDNNRQFLQLALGLSSHSSHPALKSTNVRVGDILSLEKDSADLVIAAYAMAEMPLKMAKEAAQSLWTATRHSVVIVEPGTPQGFARVLEARKVLIAVGAQILAPCTHMNVCPLSAPDWCHFKVRIARSREHLHAKNARVPFEDEKFSYLVASRHPSRKPAFRILAPPDEAKGATTFKLCGEKGLMQQSVARRDKAEYKKVRKLEWGDPF
jgi:ribosomal protein RSM22 (predicted rRNA methylase)